MCRKHSVMSSLVFGKHYFVRLRICTTCPQMSVVLIYCGVRFVVLYLNGLRSTAIKLVCLKKCLQIIFVPKALWSAFLKGEAYRNKKLTEIKSQTLWGWGSMCLCSTRDAACIGNILEHVWHSFQLDVPYLFLSP